MRFSQMGAIFAIKQKGLNFRYISAIKHSTK